mgnify:CR=1 FL=1
MIKIICVGKIKIKIEKQKYSKELKLEDNSDSILVKGNLLHNLLL